MKIFIHHIYEYRKGLRKMVLYTGASNKQNAIIEKLEKYNISYIIDNIAPKKINVFFGADECINVVKNFKTIKLDKLDDYEDFILGTMLGYDLIIQCKRFVRRKNKSIEKVNKIAKKAG